MPNALQAANMGPSWSTLHLNGPRSPLRLALLLGCLLGGQNEMKDAGEMYRQALQDFGLSGSDWGAMAMTLLEYIRIAKGRRRLHEAKLIYEPVIRKCILQLGRHHDITLRLIYETGHALQAAGALSEAEHVYRQALPTPDPGKCGHSLILLCIIDDLGVVHTQQDRVFEAENLHHAALKGFLHIFQDYYHPWVVTAVLNLAAAFRGQGKLKDTAQMLCWGSSGLQQSLGLGHADTINAFHQLAEVQSATRNFIDAEFALSSSLSGCEILHGKSHDQTLQTRVGLAVLFRDQGRYQDAKAACESLLSECTEPEIKWRSFTLNCLGTIHTLAGHFDRAEENFTQSLEGFRKLGAEGWVLALFVLYNMGNAYQYQGQLLLAESKYREAWAGLRQAFGYSHTASLAASEMLGLSLMAQNKIAEASHIASDVLEHCLEGWPRTSKTPRAMEADFERMTISCLPSRRMASFQRHSLAAQHPPI